MPRHLDGTPENADRRSVGRERERSGVSRPEALGGERKGAGGRGAASVGAQPVPERTRFVGALLGGAIGDALGQPVEGMSPPAIRARYGRLTEYQRWPGWKEGPIGTVTDDTQMTMCVAECLTARGFLDPEDLARRFVAWLPHGRGKGRTTTEAVRRLQAGEPWYRAGDDSSGSAPAMRAAPIGLLRWNDPGRFRTEAVLSALPTHRQPMGVAGAVAMAAATAWLLTREAGEWDAHEFIAAVQAATAGLEPGPEAERRDPSVKTTLHDRIGRIPALLAHDPDEVFACLYNGGYVLECLPAALYCFLRSADNAAGHQVAIIVPGCCDQDADESDGIYRIGR